MNSKWLRSFLVTYLNLKSGIIINQNCSHLNTMVTRAILLICVSLCFVHTAFGVEVLSPMERIQKRSVFVNRKEITIVPLTASLTEYLTVTLTKCDRKGVTFAVLPSLDALSKANKWTQFDGTVTETIRAGHGSNPKGMVYLALKHSAPVGRNARSYVLLQAMGVPGVVSPTPVFSVPNSKAQLQWNANTKKVNVTFPQLIKDKDGYSKLLRTGFSRSHTLSISYRMIATVAEKFTTGIAQCGTMVAGKTGLIDISKPFYSYSQGTVSFEFEPTEPVYYITLVASVAKTHWQKTSNKSWEISYYYPITRYEVPAAYIQRKN